MNLNIYKLVKVKLQKYFFLFNDLVSLRVFGFFRYQIFSLSKLNLFGRGVNLKFLLGGTNINFKKILFQNNKKNWTDYYNANSNCDQGWDCKKELKYR